MIRVIVTQQSDTCTPNISSDSCLFTRAHSLCLPCGTMNTTIISLIVANESEQ